MRLHKKLPACFAMERKHRFVVRLGAQVTKLKSYEETVLRELLAEELYHLQQTGVFRSGIYLDQPRALTKRLRNVVSSVFGPLPPNSCHSSATCHLARSVASKGDVVLFEPWASGEVLGFLACGGPIYAWLLIHTLLEDDEENSSALWQPTMEQMFVPAAQVLCPLVHHRDASGQITTMIPWPVRNWLKKQRQA